MTPTPMLSIYAAAGYGTMLVATTIDAEAGHVTKVERHGAPQWHGPVGRAILRRHLEGMRQVWSERASSWGCGRQDVFGDHMDAVEAEIRATGYTGPLA